MALSKIILKFSKNAANLVAVSSFDTPVGKVFGAADDNFLYIVTVEDSKTFEKNFEDLCNMLSCRLIDSKNKILKQLENQFTEYFNGTRKNFTIPIKTFGSDFQKSVWSKLQELPYASTQTYGDLAKALGREASHARAVGAACGANLHLIVVPCHRIVASNSKGGFNSGVTRKEWILQHEKKHAL